MKDKQHAEMSQGNMASREAFVAAFMGSDCVSKAVLLGIPSEKQTSIGDGKDFKLHRHLLTVSWIFISGRMILPLGFMSVVIMSYE